MENTVSWQPVPVFPSHTQDLFLCSQVTSRVTAQESKALITESWHCAAVSGAICAHKHDQNQSLASLSEWSEKSDPPEALITQNHEEKHLIPVLLSSLSLPDVVSSTNQWLSSYSVFFPSFPPSPLFYTIQIMQRNLHFPGVQSRLMNSVLFTQALGLQAAGHTNQILPGLFWGGHC